MILKRIRKIENVGQLLNADTNNSIGKDFTKVSVLHGLNGYGKSTLVGIFRSLKEQDASYIENKRSLPDEGDPACKLAFTTSIGSNDPETVIEYANGNWSVQFPDIEIFDSRFVSDNVFSDFEITHEHKKKTTALILGDQGVAIARSIEDTQKQISQAKSDVSATEEKIKVLLPTSLKHKVADFLTLSKEAKEKLKEKDSLEKKLKVVQEEAKVKQLSIPQGLSVPQKLQTAKTTGVETLESSHTAISEEASKKVEEHISTHLDTVGERWIRKGVEYQNKLGDKCPFCTQDVSSVKDLLDAYAGYFSQEYENFVTQTKTSLDTVGTQLQNIERQTGSIKTILTNNDLTLERAQDYLNPQTYTDVSGDITTKKESLLAKIEQAEQKIVDFKEKFEDAERKKLDNPIKPVTLTLTEDETTEEDTEEIITINQADQELETVINEYNEAIQKLRIEIEAVKNNTGSESAGDIQTKLDEIEMVEKRFGTEGETLVTDHATQSKTLIDLQTQKTNQEEQLSAHNESVKMNYLKEANDVLAQCGCRFTIKAPDLSRRGNSPVIELGFTLYEKDLDGKKFGDILSDSDKRALAFALFVAKVNLDPDVSKKIVVLDDPFTSLDDNREDSTIFEIKKLSNKCAQTIILCHYSQPTCKLVNDHTGCLQLSLQNGSEGTKFVEKNLKELQFNNHEKNIIALTHVLERGADDSDIPHLKGAIRVFVEGELKFRYKQQLNGVECTTLGSIIDELERQKNLGTKLFKKDNQDEVISSLRHLNSRTSNDHHGDPSSTDETRNIEDLKNLIRMAMRVVYEEL